MPSNNMIHSAKVASYVRRSEEFGRAKENVRINMTMVRERKRRIVDAMTDIHLNNFRKSGAELILGSGRFIGPKTLEVSRSDGRPDRDGNSFHRAPSSRAC